MSKTQETKWMRPDVGSELASIMPETNNQAETRTISTQGNVKTIYFLFTNFRIKIKSGETVQGPIYYLAVTYHLIAAHLNHSGDF